MSSDLVYFIYLDDKAITSLYSQIMPDVQSIIETKNTTKDKTYSGEIGTSILPIISPSLEYNKSTKQEAQLERRIEISLNQKAIALIRYITHDSPTTYPFRHFVNNRIITSSLITVFAEGLILTSIINSENKNSIILNKNNYLSSVFENLEHSLPAAQQQSPLERAPIEYDNQSYKMAEKIISQLNKKDIKPLSFVLEKRRYGEDEVYGNVMKRCYSISEGIPDIQPSLKSEANDIPYSITMRMGGSNFKAHMHHLTYFAQRGLSFVLYIFGEVINLGNEEYIVKPFAIWR